MAKSLRRVVGRQRLVGIMEECAALDDAAVHGDPGRLDPRRQPARHLGYRARMPQKPGWGIEGEEESRGLGSAGYGHSLDGTRRSVEAGGIGRVDVAGCDVAR